MLTPELLHARATRNARVRCIVSSFGARERELLWRAAEGTRGGGAALKATERQELCRAKKRLRDLLRDDGFGDDLDLDE